MQLRPHQIKALDVMTKKSKGQIIVPTGGGKTLCMIHDTLREYDKGWSTIVVVAPRILLANQLSTEFLEVIHDHYKHTNVLHVHSGETHHFSTTKPSEIAKWDRVRGRKIIFTTYHSLHRIQESGIYVDTIYFDEAHNAVQRNFIDSVRYFSKYALRSYFFTATPKHSLTKLRAGMNDSKIFGNVICQVPAPKLVQEGYILPPKVEIYESRILHKDELVAERDCEQMIDAIDNLTKDKVLICAKSTKQIVNLIGNTNFADWLGMRGYSYMFITAKTGAVIDGKKVTREQFFDTLSEWGKDDNKRFVVLHHSLSLIHI